MLAKAEKPYVLVARTSYAACKQLLTVNPDLKGSWIAAVLFIASNEDCTQKDLAETMGMEQVATSMMCTRLGEGRPNEPGFGLIETYTDTADRRLKRVRLTHKAKTLLNAVK